MDFGLRIWDREPAWESFQSAIRNPQSAIGTARKSRTLQGALCRL